MPDTPESLEERIVELETRLALFETMTDELSSVVADQGRTIDRLTEQLRAALGRLEEIEADLPGPGDEKPPHY